MAKLISAVMKTSGRRSFSGRASQACAWRGTRRRWGEDHAGAFFCPTSGRRTCGRSYRAISSLAERCGAGARTPVPPPEGNRLSRQRGWQGRQDPASLELWPFVPPGFLSQNGDDTRPAGSAA